MFIKGVNLGNWLVLEKWMSPHLFDGTDAEDEYYLPRQLPKEVYEARILTHRSEFITERDFAKIRHMGFTHVRIPVPYFIFGDRAPFIGCIKDLDNAFAWAEKYDLQILIDLHTAPLSQNGFDNGGISGVCRWSQTPDEVEFVLNTLEQLAERYSGRKGLWGITPINEPVTEPMWSLMDVQNHFRPVDEALACGSAPNTLAFLYSFYERAFDRISPYLSDGQYVVFHDAFQIKAWKDFLTKEQFHGKVVLDTHQYLMMAEMLGCEQSVAGYVRYVEENWAKDLKEVESYVPVVVGEWCIFNSYAVGIDTKGGQSSLNGMNYDNNQEIYSAEEKRAIYQTLAYAQLRAWQNGSGYFYWSYKLLLDTVNEPNWIGWDAWDLGRAYDLRWFPSVY